MDYTKYIAYLRQNLGISTSAVEGAKKITEHGRLSKVPINRMAYILATAYWESAKTMQPVKEAFWKDEDWRRLNLRYYPWYGRGLIQTTWEDNYRKIAVAMGLRPTIFTDNPNLLLDWKYAIPALFVGMEKGIYTGKDLDDYIDLLDEDDTKDYAEYVAARRIVNGTDKASDIANIALKFERALKVAGYVGGRGSGGGGLNFFEALANFFRSLFGGGSSGSSSGSSRNPDDNNDWR